MRGKKSVLGFLSCLSLLGWLSFLGPLIFVQQAAAFIVINEILADPAAGLAGDANNDGVRSASNDEFVEILNYGSSPVDLSGWSLSDGSAVRHIFPSATDLLPYQYLAVFGGGSPHLNGVFWQLASTGALSLNNTNETISLRDADVYLIDQVHYGSEGDKDQSLTRFPEGTSQIFVGHKSLPQSAGAAFSPGTGVDGKPLVVSPVEPLAAASVPELPTLGYLAWGGLGLLRFRRRRSTGG